MAELLAQGKDPTPSLAANPVRPTADVGPHRR